jgi:hypothetical protein
MSFNTNITVGRPPLLWSDMQEAFTKVNENFDILVATIGDGSGLSPINFETLDTSLKPTTDNLYDLGDITHKWKSVYTGEYSVTDSSNGLWAGNAQIKGVGYTVNLPPNSTVGGDPITGIGAELILDPAKTFFKEIQVDNNFSVVATQFADTFNLLSGSGISLGVSSGADSITVSNSGIITINAGLGINSSTVSGVATITNSGVRSIENVASLPSGRVLGAGINISAPSGDNIKVTNTGIISVSSGVGITVSLDAATGDATITNSLPAGNTFAQVEVNGDSANRLVADASADVLNITSGQGITLSKTVATDTLNISVNPVFDLKGSVFGDDSTKIIDAVENKVYGGIFATTLRTEESKIALGQGAGGDGLQGLESVAIGFTAGGFTQGDYAVAIGSGAGNIGQGNRAVAIGATAGVDQGDYAISIGNSAGYPSAVSGSIAINASGFTLDAPAAGFYVNPIRSTANGRPLMYDTSTKELFSSNVLEFFGSRISTSDSSGITVDVQTTFNTDVVFENDITVAERLNLKGSRVISLAELKAVVAVSSSFADFQAQIAAMI